jgi:beta-galactosidase beta subunit
VQIILEGSEEVAWAERDSLDVTVAYDDAKDAERLDGERDHSMLVGAGMFWIALPHDAHRACGHTELAHSYRKIVMKLPIR